VNLVKRKASLIEIVVVIFAVGFLIVGISQAMEMFAESSLKNARNLLKSARLS
jgi:hypothetical protein